MRDAPDLTICLPGLRGHGEMRNHFRAAAAERDLALLGRCLSKGRVTPWTQGCHGALCALFGLTAAGEQSLPLAALSRLGEGDEVAMEGYWLRADPVCLEPDRDCVVLRDHVIPDPRQVSILLALLNDHLAGEGLRLEAPAAGRWYLFLKHSPDLVTWPLAKVLGEDIHPWLPDGAEGRRWRRLLNEIQMLLHGCEVNAARRARGELPVTGLWLWGGGRLPPAHPAPWTALWSDVPLARGLARWSGIPLHPLPVDGRQWLQALETGGAHLLVVEALWPWAQLGQAEAWAAWLEDWQERWLAPLVDALSSGRVASLTLHDGAGRATRLVGRRLGGWWRRRRAFEELL